MDMTDKVKIKSDEFWQYSLEVYDSIKDIAIKLQDKYDLNINLLLLSGYTQTLGCAIDEYDMQNLISHTKQWQNNITSPYRTLRRELKETISHNQYQAMLQMELALEREEQWRLAQILPALPPHNVEAQANILSYLIACNVPLEKLTESNLMMLYSIGQRVAH